MVEFDERAGEVESDAGAHVSVVGGGGRLIEPLEDVLELVGRNLLAVVADGDGGCAMSGLAGVFLMADAEEDFAVGGCELEGVAQDVDHDLVELSSVDPYGQLCVVVLVAEVDALGASLIVEEGVDVFDEGHEVGS